MGKRVKTICHTRIERETAITAVRADMYNPMGLIVEFSYSLPSGFFKEEHEMPFGLYIDKEFVCEFYDKVIKVQVENLNVVQEVIVYAHPHPGFQFEMDRETPGNKIRLRFRGKDPTKADVLQHNIYWDNKTGSYLTKRVGIVDATDGETSGSVFNTGEIIDG